MENEQVDYRLSRLEKLIKDILHELQSIDLTLSAILDELQKKNA